MTITNVQTMAKKSKNLGDDARSAGQKMRYLREKYLPELLEKKLMDNTDKAFDNEQYPKKPKWKGRNPKYLEGTDKQQNDLPRDQRRGILIGKGSGELRHSIETETSDGIVSIGTDKIYAQIHNEGLEGNAFGKYKFEMPQRQFMPIGDEEPPFQDEVDKWMDKQMDDILG